MDSTKNISYLNKDFSSLKSDLIKHAKTYFPSTYNDFSEASPGMMFIEMASYVGDVMSFYLDNQFQENLLLYAKNKDNIMSIAYALGYVPQNSYASSTTIDIYQLLPVTSSLGYQVPDFRYSLVFQENTVLKSSSTEQKFITIEEVDFSNTGSVELTLLNDQFFMAKKSVKAISAEIKSTSFTFTNPSKFTNVTLEDSKIIKILSVSGSDGSKWYEVPYLAQESIINKISNPNSNTDNVPYLMSLQKVSKRFTSRFQSNGSLKIEFGAGISSMDDNQILPTPDNVQLGLVPSINNLLDDYNKASILFTKEYGVAPSNVTLTFNYLVGGGIISNVPANDISLLDSINYVSFKQTPPNLTIGNDILNINNIIINNPLPAVGGRDGDTVEEIRLNALSSFSAQNRAVTKEDYMYRALSMPAGFGTVSKALLIPDSLLTTNSSNDPLIDNSPLSLSLYILAYDNNKKLVTASNTLKENLKKYIDQYRMITDSINIKDAFYINIGVNFDITVLPNFNNSEILSNCISAIKEYFNIEKWQINQPIILSDLYSILLKIKGVQSVSKIEIINKQSNDGTYSLYGYDISSATKNNVIYPSIDPSIFEIRYPDLDIKGRSSSL